MKVALIQEHHQNEEKWAAATKQFAQQGWALCGKPAPATGKGGTRGSPATLVRKHLDWQHQGTEGDGPGFDYGFLRWKRHTVAVFSVYLDVGSGLCAEPNAAIIQQLVAVVRALQCPWICAGDWNAGPADLRESGIITLMQGEILNVGMASIDSGNEIDFAIVSKRLRPFCTCQRNMHVPWRPHVALQIDVQQTFELEQFPVLTRHRPIAALQGPNLPWGDFLVDETQVELKWLTGHRECSSDECLTKGYAAWASQAESFLLGSDVTASASGRGCILQYEHKPRMVCFPKGQEWKGAGVAHWTLVHRSLKATRENAQQKHQADALVKLVQLADALHKHWPEGFVGPFSVLGLKFVLQNVAFVGDVALDRAEQQVASLRREVAKQLVLQNKLDIRDWAKRAVQGTARQAHQYLKKQEGLPVRPFQTLRFDDRAEARRQYWVRLWGEEPVDVPLSPLREKIKHLACEQASTLKRISSKQVHATLMLMANKKGGLDGFQFKDLKQLPLQAFSGLAWMYERIEATGKWPQQMLWVMVACLPKSDVAERPIGLLATCYSLWAKMRKFLLTRWQQSAGVKADWD